MTSILPGSGLIHLTASPSLSPLPVSEMASLR